jgi:hypothetical protein
MPTDYHYKYKSRIPGASWAFDFENIEYSDLDLRMEDIKFDLTRMDNTWGEIKMDCPALKYWAISGVQTFHHWFYPSKSETIIYIEDLDIDLGFDLVLDDEGYLDPKVWDVMINMGETYIYHDNLFVTYTMHQILELGKVIIQNSAFFWGDRMFSSLLGPVMDKHMNHYTHNFTQRSFISGQNSQDEFVFDFRNTMDPYVSNGMADFRFLGALGSSKLSSCENFNPSYMWWHGTHIESQLAVSEDAANCAAK